MSKPALGIVLDEPDEVYFRQDADKIKVGSSMLKEFCVNRKLFFKQYVEKSIPPPPEKQAFPTGKLLEYAMVYGWEAALQRAVVVDVASVNTKAYEAAAREAPEGSIVITRSDLLAAREVYDRAICTSPHIKALVPHARHQVVFRFEARSFYLQCKADIFLDANEYPDDWEYLKQFSQRWHIFDTKTTNCIHGSHAHTFDRQVWSFGYDVQAAFYRLVAERVLGEKPEWHWLAIEKQEPYDVDLVRMNFLEMETAQDYVLGRVQQLQNCFDLGCWDNSLPNGREVRMPAWRAYELG